MPTKSVSSRQLEVLERQNPGPAVQDWQEWVRWILKHYDAKQVEISRQLGCSVPLISRMMNEGISISPAIKLALASYAVDRGPQPPEFRVPVPLLHKLDQWVTEKRSGETS